MLSRHFKRTLCRVPLRWFRKKEPQDLKQQINSSVNKIKHRQSIKDMDSFKSFVDDSITKNTLTNKMKKSAK